MEVIFRSGNTIKIYCKDFEVTTNTNGELTGYSYENSIDGKQVVFMSLSDIVCIRRLY